MTYWAIEWHSVNKLDGDRRHLYWPEGLKLFRTKKECRAMIEKHFGYIRDSPDLRREPHGWRMPKAVRVRVVKVGV